jgi:hypothetical protein
LDFTGLPTSEDYRAADKLIGKFLSMKRECLESIKRGNSWSDLWDGVTSYAPFLLSSIFQIPAKQTHCDSIEKVRIDLWSVVTRSASIWKKSRTLNALPEDSSMLIPGLGTEVLKRVQDIKRSIRELSWLEKHGQCMDNIKVGQSQNPDVGRGAFANRFIPKGGLVAPAPLIHIPDSSVLTMYDPSGADEKGNVLPDLEWPVTSQLLLNYCFGHQESTLLLCPFGYLTAFINHSHDNPNTRIRWTRKMRHPRWRHDSIEEWGRVNHAGLSFDFVALRDIQEGEEILIDYGEAWEEAWQAHERSFVPREDYIPAQELNEIPDFVFPTEDEEPLEGVSLWCHKYYVKHFVSRRSRFGKRDSECRILKRLGEDRYTVQLIGHQKDKKTAFTHYIVGEILWDVPSDAFFFKDLPYSRDHLKSNAFRHAMMIPDDMFPNVWKNSK